MGTKRVLDGSPEKDRWGSRWGSRWDERGKECGNTPATHRQYTGRTHLLFPPMHDGNKPIGGWLWPNPLARKAPFEEIPAWID